MGLTNIEKIEKTIEERALGLLGNNLNGAVWTALRDFIDSRDTVSTATAAKKLAHKALASFPSLDPLWAGHAALRVELGEFDYYLLMSESKPIPEDAPRVGKVTEVDIRAAMADVGCTAAQSAQVVEVLAEAGKLKAPKASTPSLRTYQCETRRGDNTQTATVVAHNQVFEIGLSKI